jgi:hypothetical protein
MSAKKFPTACLCSRRRKAPPQSSAAELSKLSSNRFTLRFLRQLSQETEYTDYPTNDLGSTPDRIEDIALRHGFYMQLPYPRQPGTISPEAKQEETWNACTPSFFVVEWCKIKPSSSEK